MIKFVLGVCIVAFTSFCGYVLSKKYRQRKSFYLQFYQFNERFLSEIAYYRRPIKEFIAKYAYQGEFSELLEEYVQTLGVENRNPSERDFVGLSTFSFLSKDETDFVNDYFLMVGKGDSSSQKAYFGSVKNALSEKKDAVQTESKRYGDLYIKLGFLLGLAILVVII